MSLEDENKILYVLHRNGVNRKHIKFIMNDLKESNTFCDKEYDVESEWDFLDEQAFWLFDSEVSNEEKINALKNLRKKQEEFEKSKKSQFSSDQEQRILDKIKELTEKGVISPNKSKTSVDEEAIEFTTRYGRSPLHEAIAVKDIHLIEKYLQVGKYLDKVDNNGHTAMEMAHYDNYQEALFLFEKYMKKSGTS